MSFRFSKRVRICPGLYLNLSKGGLSVSAGVPGAHINVGAKGTYLSSGIPGTGLSFREKIGGSSQPPKLLQERKFKIIPLTGGEIRSADVDNLTGMEFSETKEMIEKACADRADFEAKLVSASAHLFWLKALYVLSLILIIGLIVKWFKEKVENQKTLIKKLTEEREACRIDLDTIFDDERQKLWQDLENAFKTTLISQRIWAKTRSLSTDSAKARTIASSLIERVRVTFDLAEITVLKSTHAPFHLQNPNGPDLFIYPAFILARNSESHIAVLGFKEFELIYLNRPCIEEEWVPPDSKQVGTAWKKANKDGGPDRRFKNNFQIPIVMYGEFSIRNSAGLNECFLVSNCEATKAFAETFLRYQKTISGIGA